MESQNTGVINFDDLQKRIQTSLQKKYNTAETGNVTQQFSGEETILTVPYTVYALGQNHDRAVRYKFSPEIGEHEQFHMFYQPIEGMDPMEEFELKVMFLTAMQSAIDGTERELLVKVENKIKDRLKELKEQRAKSNDHSKLLRKLREQEDKHNE